MPAPSLAITSWFEIGARSWAVLEEPRELSGVGLTRTKLAPVLATESRCGTAEWAYSIAQSAIELCGTGGATTASARIGNAQTSPQDSGIHATRRAVLGYAPCALMMPEIG